MEARADGHPFLDGRESVGELIGLLGHSSLRARRAAVAALARRDPSETLPGVLGALGDEENATTRNAAGDVLLRYGQAVIGALTRALEPDRQRDRTIQILGLLARIPSRETVDAVLPLAAHADASVAAAAIGCLGGLRDPSSVPALLSVVDRGERWQTFYAIDALGEIGHAAAVARLVPLVEDPYYRKAVLRALGRIGDESSVKPLVASLARTARSDRTALASLNEMVDRTRSGVGRERMLARIRLEMSALDGDELTRGLEEVVADGDEHARRHALRALGWLGGVGAIRPLVEGLAEPQLADVAAEALAPLGTDHSDAILAATTQVALPAGSLGRVIEAVGPVSSPAVETFLAAALDHEDEEVRQSAATIIAARVQPEHLELLIKVLGDPSPGVADEAVRGLLMLAREEMHDQVAGRVEGLTASPSPEVRRAALRIVAKIGSEGAADILNLALQDPAASVRREATALMGEDPDPNRLWRLTAALADEDSRVREAAVLAVGRMRDERARGVLLASLHDQSIWVRCRAARALAEHPAVEVQAALEEAARSEVLPVRVSAVEALGHLRPATGSILAEMSRDSEAEVRRAVLRALSTGPPEAPMATLSAALEDPIWSVRCAAAEALGMSGQAGGFGPLSHALDREADAIVRRALLSALFAVDAEAALPFLVAALAEKDVAETAAELLVEGHRVFADELRAEWASGVDPATREGLAVVLEEIGRREQARPADGSGERT